MSLVRFKLVPRTYADFDNWYHPNWDLGEYNSFDSVFNRHNWLQRPSNLFYTFMKPKIAIKYRVTVDIFGYHPKSVTIEIKEEKLMVVSARHLARNEQGVEYTVKEFKKTYKVPDNAIVENLTSYVAEGRFLVIEIPLRQQEAIAAPEPVDDKMFKISCILPEGLDTNKLNVSCKGHDLTVKAEDNKENEKSVSSVFFYQNYKLPENADVSAIKCVLSENRLNIQAPLSASYQNKPSIENKLDAPAPTQVQTQTSSSAQSAQNSPQHVASVSHMINF